jgi:DNA invertase Pin-like site-specific DNA recombinase
LVCTDQNIDTSSPEGRYFVNNLGAFAEYEREIIGVRTKEGLKRAKAQGKRLGRRPKPELTEEILKLKAEGKSLRQIGAQVGMSHQAVKQRLRRARLQKGDGNEECGQRPAV